MSNFYLLRESNKLYKYILMGILNYLKLSNYEAFSMYIDAIFVLSGCFCS